MGVARHPVTCVKYITGEACSCGHDEAHPFVAALGACQRVAVRVMVWIVANVVVVAILIAFCWLANNAEGAAERATAEWADPDSPMPDAELIQSLRLGLQLGICLGFGLLVAGALVWWMLPPTPVFDLMP